jgi:arsenite methyltransferase
MTTVSTLSLTLDTLDLARHYEDVSSNRQFKAGKILVEKLGIRTGDRVLDVGSGTGLLAEHVAALVGSSGAVVAIDPLPLRIEIAKKRAAPNLVFRVGDAFDLGGFADATFDAVYLNAVLHWLPEKSGPIGQFHRLLAAGGRLGITTGSKEHPGPLQTIRKAILAREPYARFPESKAGVAARVSVDELRGLLVQAGFKVRSIELSPNVAVHASADAAIDFSQASSFGNFLGHLPDDLRRAARDEIRKEVEALRTPEGIRFESTRIFAIAVKSGGSAAGTAWSAKTPTSSG